MTVTVEIRAEWEAVLAKKAAEEGMSLDMYVQHLVSREAAESETTTLDDAARLRRAEAARRIRELAAQNQLGPEVTVRDLIEEGRRY